MKKLMIILAAMLTIAAPGRAMSYEQARNEALFLTDKMAYELNLTNEQYEAAYEINLDYLMGVTSYDDVYGTYWERRNLDLSYILLDWQWQAYRAATYFYRPLYWRGGYWHFGIYARYPHRDYFYFGRPVFYASYRGGHAWHVVGGRGYYYARREHFHPGPGHQHFGMLDRWNRGDYRNHHHVNSSPSQAHFGGNRNSSTRSTVNGHHNSNHSLGGYRSSQQPVHSQPSASTSHSAPNMNRPSTTVNHSAPNMNRPSTTVNRPAAASQPSTTTSHSPQGSSNHSLGGSRSSSSVGGSATRSSAGSSAGRSSAGGRSYGGRR